MPKTIKNAVFSGVSDVLFIYSRIKSAHILINSSVFSEIIFGLRCFAPKKNDLYIFSNPVKKRHGINNSILNLVRISPSIFPAIKSGNINVITADNVSNVKNMRIVVRVTACEDFASPTADFSTVRRVTAIVIPARETDDSIE